MAWLFKSSKNEKGPNENDGEPLTNITSNEQQADNDAGNGNGEAAEGFQSKYKYALKEQNEEQPMDLGTLQDIFSFNFMNGRPIINFILAFLWDIGLPVVVYNIAKPHVGQVVAMIIAAAPPLGIVIYRMVRDRKFDPLGCVTGISFLISGILSIIQPNPKTSAICESIVPLLIGLFCIISTIPIKIGSFEFKPFVFQLANQIMPRAQDSTKLQEHDDNRLVSRQERRQQSGEKRLDFLYNNMAKFRHDMRFMTVTWGLLLIASCVVKIIIVETSADISKAQTYGYVMFGVLGFVMMAFTWVYTNIVKGHVLSQVTFWKQQPPQEIDGRMEAVENVNWGVNSMSNAFNQIAG